MCLNLAPETKLWVLQVKGQIISKESLPIGPQQTIENDKSEGTKNDEDKFLDMCLSGGDIKIL